MLALAELLEPLLVNVQDPCHLIHTQVSNAVAIEAVEPFRVMLKGTKD